MTDSLIIKVDSRDVKQADKELDKLERQSEQTERATDQLTRATKKYNASLSDQSKQLGKIAAAGAAVALTLITAKTVQAVRANLDYIDSLSKSADKIGIQTDKLSILRFAAEQTSGTFQGIDEALTKATKRLGEFNANGAGASGKWLQTLNLDTKELAELDPAGLFQAYSAAISALPDRAQKLAAASALMGDESRKFLTLMEAGPDAMAAFGDEARRLGIVVSEIDAKKIEQANDALNRADKALVGVGRTLTIEVAPYITAAADAFTEMALSGMNASATIESGLQSIVYGVGVVMDAWHGFEIVVTTVGKTVAAEFQTMLDGFVWIDQGISNLLDKLPGVSAKPSTELQTWAVASGYAVDDLTAKLKQLKEDEWPSDSVSKLASDIVTRAHNIATETVVKNNKVNTESTETVTTTFDTIIGSTAGTDTAPLDRVEAALRSSLDAQLQANIDTAESLKTDVWEAYYTGLIDTKQEAEDKILEITEVSTKQEAEIRRNQNSVSIGHATQFADNLLTIAAVAGQKQSKVFKALSIANTTVKTYESATSAYASLAPISIVGPALGAAAAGAAIAAGLANVAAISSTNYSGAYDQGGYIPAGKFGIVGEYGPELVDGPAVVTGRNETAKQMGGSSSNVNINFNMQSLDPSKSADVIVQNRGTIVSIIRGAFNESGINSGI